MLQHTTQAGGFKGCCNVRVYRARFGLTGLKTAVRVKDGEDMFVHAELTHGGDEAIVNHSNVSIQFEHSPVATIYSYCLRKSWTMEYRRIQYQPYCHNVRTVWTIRRVGGELERHRVREG